jgi:murein peptide amidase A
MGYVLLPDIIVAKGVGIMERHYHYTQLGESVKGLRIDYHGFYPQGTHLNDEQEPTSIDWLVLGAFHGDEPESAELCFRLLHDMHHDAEFLKCIRVGVVPIVNPDGLLLNTRKNANQVDINRNFETQNWEASEVDEHYHGGGFPFSEPETRIVARLIQQTNPRVILTYHTPYRLINYDDSSPQTQEMANVYGQSCNYPVEASIGYPTPGSFGNWAGVERGIHVLTVELPEGEAMGITWPAHRKAIEALYAMETPAM